MNNIFVDVVSFANDLTDAVCDNTANKWSRADLTNTTASKLDSTSHQTSISF
jgi:hypothetical protein